MKKILLRLYIILVKIFAKNFTFQIFFLFCYNRFFNYKIKHVSDKVFAIKDDGKYFFYDFERGLKRYTKGLLNFTRKLGNSYHLNKVDFKDDDIFIDCGANIGELFFYFNKILNVKIRYFGFEPDLNVFALLKKNISNQNLINSALSQKKGFEKFLLKSDTADSSLDIQKLKNAKKGEIALVETTTIDFFFEKYKFIKCLKVEAEGNELDVLKGSVNSLHKIEYITVDGSQEKGFENEETLSSIINFLLDHNFVLISIDLDRKRGQTLFKNKSYV